MSKQRTSMCWNQNESDAFTETVFEKIHHKKPRTGRKFEFSVRNARQEKQFRCQNCGLLVSTDPELAGVNNRNHCPNCLWSRHVDQDKAGDRKADCRARMQPVGLTVKQTHKKYAGADQGELMLIHRCSACGKISINRIAADDSAGQLYRLYRISFDMKDALRSILVQQSIHLLGAGDLTTVFSQLFGWQAITDEFQAQPHVLMAELDRQYLEV